MLTLEEIRKALSDRNLREVARRTGVHYNVIYRIANGTTNPSYASCKALSDYLTTEAA